MQWQSETTSADTDGSVVVSPQFATLPPSAYHLPITQAPPTEVSPLMGNIHPHACSGNSSMGAKMSRAALAVAAGVVTVCVINQHAVALAQPALPSVQLTAQQQVVIDLYCQGPLLDAVQRAKVFNDSKHFVDMPVKTTSSPAMILQEFKNDIQPMIGGVSACVTDDLKTTLEQFLAKHFDEPGSEIQKTVPSDFSESTEPPRITAITNAAHKKWALGLHALWKELGRSPSRNVVTSYLHPTPLPSLGDSSTSTLIVVPGGRFRESYYWDSYWIVEGLLVSNMATTARRVVQNLLEYVAEFGFVPNGGRIYYLTRSQPPLLSDMVRLVAMKDTTGFGRHKTVTSWDLDYLRRVVPVLEKEYAFWMNSHRVDITRDGVKHALNLYTAETNAPRPESYREDVHLAEKTFPGNTKRQHELYDDLAAAAESGWDFSSRWFKDQKTLATVETRDIVPVDLNTIMYRFESNLAEFHKALGNATAASVFTNAALARGRAIDAVFWHATSGSWRDYVVSTATHSPVVSASNYFPLWAGRSFVESALQTKDRRGQVVQSLRDSKLIQVAGIQTTTLTTTEQWDAPNAWPPLQDILIEGLFNVATNESTQLANDLVQTWIRTSFAAWNETGLMFEKYNATVVGGLGKGGEYTPQFGFGWTNGVVLKFLTEYQDVLGQE